MKDDLLPCEVNAGAICATCSLHNNGCPIEAMCGAKGAYDIVKAFNPIKTTAKVGDVQNLVKDTFPKLYKDLQLSRFDWQNDLDGVLDFLYGERELGIMCTLRGIAKSSVTELIKFIESKCEVRRG